MPQPVEAILIGAGSRGANAYAPYALQHPDEICYVAVAEPDPIRRERFARQHNIAPEMRFSSWEELLARGQIADVAFVCTPDRFHVEPSLAVLQAGYHVLLEKPIAPDLAGCVQLVQAAERAGRMLQIGHVLRYTSFFSTLHDIIESGRLGDIMTVEHRENVAYFHMAHSYVRGNWRRVDESNPMILSKCSHDLDILAWNMGRCTSLSSMGSLLHFRPQTVGPEIPDRCVNGCPVEPTCPFSAIGIYLDYRPWKRDDSALPFDPEYPDVWPFNVIAADMSYAGRRSAIETGPYGRCVYRSDNDVVDQQVVAMEFESGATVSLSMHGHSNEEHRSMRYDGTRATLRGRFGANPEITIHDHLTGRVENIDVSPGTAGHGGGDAGLMAGLVRSIRGEAPPRTTARASLESHLLAFAAEEARLQHSVINMDDYRARAEALIPAR